MPEQPSDLSIRDRLSLVYERLDQMPAPTSAQEAFDRLNNTLDQVEDEYSGVPKNPNPGLKFDGRMYPPRGDYIEHADDGKIFAATKGNTIQAEPDGTLTVNSRSSGRPVYHREGAGSSQESDRGADLEIDNPKIAEAFEAVRRAQQGVAPPGKVSRTQSDAPAPRRDTHQRESDRGTER